MNDTSQTNSNASRTVVWDIPTRLFHWSLALLFFSAWVTAEIGDNLMDAHKLIGYAILALVLFRWLWGFAGSSTSRFSDFIHGPLAAMAHLKEVKSGKPAPHAGHNPLGGWMVLALLLLLLVQAGTGLFANDDIMTEGPLKHLVSDELSSRLTGIHHLVFDGLLVLVGLHVAAILAYRFRLKENLVLPMLTGRKELPPGMPTPRIASTWLALILFLLAAGGVAALINLI